MAQMSGGGRAQHGHWSPALCALGVHTREQLDALVRAGVAEDDGTEYRFEGLLHNEEAPPPGCPACGPHGTEDRWHSGNTGDDCDEHLMVLRCACGMVRLDGRWYAPMPRGEG